MYFKIKNILKSNHYNNLKYYFYRVCLFLYFKNIFKKIKRFFFVHFKLIFLYFYIILKKFKKIKNIYIILI
jgi:hypothetical protein